MPFQIFADARLVVHIVASLDAYARTIPHFEDQLQMYHTTESSNGGDAVRYEDFREMKEGFHTLEKIFRAMKGDQVFGAPAKEMCLVSGLVISAKFKTPDFEKYKGNTSPKIRLTMYYCKMASHVEDGKLMIHYFQDSLSGAPSKWYLSLDQSRITCF